MGPIEGFTGDVKIAERLGNLLGLEASKVFLSLSTSPTRKKLHEIIESGAPLTQYIDEPIAQESDKLRFISRTVSLPYRNPFSNKLESSEEKLVNCRAELQELLDRGGKEEGEAVIKKRQQMDRLTIYVNQLHRYRETSHQFVPIHAIRIGPVAILAMGNEPYCEIGVEVKRNSLFPHTMFAAYLAGNSVYIPTPDVYLPQSPFEVEYSPFSPDAAQLLVEAANSLLHELKTSEMNEEETKYNS
ncbi:hypothetical protein [Paenibacillus koleovorans]|uniref:hypothetical protein n=1 Tax=Paenibacillus koleovorans TaxID=121608 RepID=UPI001FEC2F7E|nr:hypothetical protein [Paenibacillus koleovorans]